MAVNNVDLKLTKGEDRDYYDISFDENGDFDKVAGFDTAILMSFTCERRASESEVKEPHRRRGWWGNTINGFDNFEYGSKDWLLNQARANQLTLNNSITYGQQALQWFIDDNHVDTVIVDASYDSNTSLIRHIEFIRNNNRILTKSYNLWENTFVDGEI